MYFNPYANMGCLESFRILLLETSVCGVVNAEPCLSLLHRIPNNSDCGWQCVRGFAAQYDPWQAVPGDCQRCEGSGGK